MMESGGFIASYQFFMSQPSLSRNIEVLESELGVTFYYGIKMEVCLLKKERTKKVELVPYYLWKWNWFQFDRRGLKTGLTTIHRV